LIAMAVAAVLLLVTGVYAVTGYYLKTF